ncbi:MAG: hypothetical protein U0263_14600 [Polyangiaceae bacterium]
MLTSLAAALVAAPFGDFFWQSPIFANDNWSQVMNGLRIGLTLGAALLLIYEVRARRMGESLPDSPRPWITLIVALAALGLAISSADKYQKLAAVLFVIGVGVAAFAVASVRGLNKRLAVTFTILSFGAYFDFFNPNVRYPEYYHRHEFYHYYLGSKYSHELSYTRLYECTAIAEIELGRGDEVRKREIRDLRVNLIKPVADTFVVTDPSQCKKHFTPPKWEAFKKDVNWFWSTARGSYWENMMKDHGYNPPPVWTMTGKFFSSFGVAGDGFFKVLSGLDVMFHLGIVLLMYWAFGWRIGALATVFWGCNAPANFYWTGGAFMRQDWIFFLVASLALARKRRFFLAGFALTWSALLRVFPMIFFAGWAIIIGFYVLRELRERRAGRGNGEGLMGFFHPDHRKLLAGCIIASATLIPASVVVAGGDSYKEFVSHTLKTHNNTPLTNHMGLETILVHNWDGRMRFTRDDNLDDPFQGWKQGRIDRHKKLKWVHFGIIALVFGWTAWALRRTKSLWVAEALAAPLVMCMTNLTCYYYSMFMLCAALAKPRRPLGPVVLVTSGASQILLLSYYWVDDKFTAQAWLFAIFSIVLLWGYSRPFSFERLKAWWDGKPEPKPGGESTAPLPAE